MQGAEQLSQAVVKSGWLSVETPLDKCVNSLSACRSRSCQTKSGYDYTAYRAQGKTQLAHWFHQRECGVGQGER